MILFGALLSSAASATEGPPPPAPAPAPGAAPGPAPVSAPKPTSAPGAVPEMPKAVSQELDFGWQILKMIGALAIVCGLGYVGIRVLASRTEKARRGDGSLIRVHDVKRLEAKASIYLVEVAGQFVLVGVGEHEVRCLTPSELDPLRVREALAERDRQQPAKPQASSPFSAILAKKERLP